jgi:hypothetical protein
MIDLIIQDDGNLLIELSGEPTDYEKQFYLDLSPINALCELLDTSGYIGNGWQFLKPEDIGALISDTCPIISNDVDIEDDGSISHIGDIWYYPDYAVSNEIEILFEKGSVIFEKVRE